MRRYPLIAIEGTDAAGKATHSKALAEKMGGLRISFPVYESPTGKLIKAHLHREWNCRSIDDAKAWWPNEPVQERQHEGDALVFQALMTVNRLECASAITRALVTQPVILDRYWASGLVYGQADGLDPAWLRSIHEIMPHPDLWLLLDIDPADSVRRRPERRDRYEKQPGLMDTIVAKYREVWIAERSMHVYRPKDAWTIIDARGSREDTFDQIVDAVRKLPVSLGD